MSDYSANDDIKLYEEWCEWNKNNEPISFAEYCYRQGRADERERIVRELENQLTQSNCEKGIEFVLKRIKYIVGNEIVREGEKNER